LGEFESQKADVFILRVLDGGYGEQQSTALGEQQGFLQPLSL
jgi:hypothetical protein